MAVRNPRMYCTTVAQTFEIIAASVAACCNQLLYPRLKYQLNSRTNRWGCTLVNFKWARLPFLQVLQQLDQSFPLELESDPWWILPWLTLALFWKVTSERSCQRCYRLR